MQLIEEDELPTIEIDDEGDFYVEGEDEEESGENCYLVFYPLFILHNFPPEFNPLGDDGDFLYGELVLSTPYTFFGICMDAQNKGYRTLYDITKNMSVFKRKYLLEVLRCILYGEECTRADVCARLTLSLNIKLAREMCRVAFKNDFLREYVEEVKDYIIPRKKFLRMLFDNDGEILYWGWKLYLENKGRT